MSRRFSDFALWLVTRPRAEGRRRVGVVVFAVLAVLLIGVADFATGEKVAFGVFYVVPVVAATILAGGGPAVALSALAAALWVYADAGFGGTDNDVYAWNVPLRFTILAFIVLLLSTMRSLLDRAAASERRARDFLADAAHQLRTPVAAVRATADTLLLSDAPDEQLLANLAGEATRMGRLVQALLRIADLDEAGTVPAVEYSPGAICREEVDRFRDLVPLSIDFAIADDVPPVVRGDADGVREALANLLDNARAHARHAVSVEVGSLGSAVRISVTDDGPGVPAGAEGQIFERFVSLDGRGGAGLGLAIARQIVRRQGGDLVYARPSFVLSVPASQRNGHS